MSQTVYLHEVMLKQELFMLLFRYYGLKEMLCLIGSATVIICANALK